KNYMLSYKRKGLPFLETYNGYTEFELGYFDAKASWKSAEYHQIQYYPLSVNLQYYIPVSFFADPYVKAGVGVLYRKWQVNTYQSQNGYSSFGPEIKNDSSFISLGKIGLGWDLLRSAQIGLQVDITFTHYVVQEMSPDGVSINGGLSYNW
ncbi:MAG: hypothetical protein ACYC5N_11520, partial [Endomicrobiales bacterium]